MYTNTQGLSSSGWLINCVKGVLMREIAQSTKSSPTPEPIQNIKCTVST